MQISILAYFEDGHLEVHSSLEELVSCRSAARIWVDLESSNDSELRKIAEHFSLHELAVEDCLTPGHFPKIEDFGSYLFLIFRGLKSGSEVEEIWKRELDGEEEEIPEEVLDEENDEVFTRKVAIFLGEKFIVTYRRRAVNWLDAVVRSVKQDPSLTLGVGTDAVAYKVLDVLVDRFMRRVGLFEELIDKIEDTAVESPEDFQIQNVLSLKRDLIAVRQLMREQRVVIARLANESKYIKQQQLRYFRDIDDHSISVLKTLDKEIESLHGVRDTYFAMANVRLGNIMRILAVITTIAAPLNILVGVYGMNFEVIPLLHSPHGFWAILSSMVLMAVVMVLYFRNKQWF
ncbi:MAG: magnesium transporter CorA family protein [Bdellovibrionales bacterium]|nr:magnesium transporter CorA family protein [Bdellovibrionales bacterium]